MIASRYFVMNHTLITLSQVSVTLIAFAIKGNQDGTAQQIHTMGLLPWLSLVAVWMAERVHTEAARIRELLAPFPPAFHARSIKSNLIF